jgi:hypothetical protein
MRPNIIDQGEITYIATSLGRPIDVSQWEPALSTYVVLATSSNIYFNQPNGSHSVTPVLNSSDGVDYSLNAFSYNPRLVKYQNVATVGSSFIFTLNTTNSSLYNITGVATYTVVPLGFSPGSIGTYMDGYCFAHQHNGDTIYNSNLNDISTWNIAINNIRATQFTGAIRALGRLEFLHSKRTLLSTSTMQV